MDKEDFISFESIRKTSGISNEKKFTKYLAEVYKDLSNRSLHLKKGNNGVAKLIFVEFMKIPIFICEKLFLSFDQDKDGFLNFNEFVINLVQLYNGSFIKTARLIFNLLDFDQNGLLSKSNSRLILSHLPLPSEKNEPLSYKYQIESLSEIDEIISNTFGQNEKLGFKQFLDVIEKKKSDLYFVLLTFIYQNKPFDNENIEMISRQSATSLNISTEDTENNSTEVIKIKTPNRKSMLAPTIAFFNAQPKDLNSPSKRGVVRLSNEIVDNTERFISPSWYLKGERQIIKVDDFNLEDKKQEHEHPKIIYENWIYKLEKSKLQKIFLVVLENVIYFYKNEKKEELIQLNHLSGCFVKAKGEKEIQSKKYHMFTIYIMGKLMSYYCESAKISNDFVSAFKIAFNYQNFFDYYEICGDISEGQFGIVKLGIHKKTKEKVAIKIVRKDNLKPQEMEFIKNEIDIMKVCHHPNVIHLLDHFENADFIFIIMEYLSGGNLREYLIQNQNKLTEKKSLEIIYQIGKGLQYLHHLGIVHRDLKPENIMLSNQSDNFTVKIMDFGLSKVISRNETMSEGYGTLSYAAPEILTRQPYNFKVDIWSLGVILFAILSGSLPFESEKEENLIKMTIFDKVNFNQDIWNKYSNKIVDLITSCLQKNPEDRINIDEFLNTSCFIKT